MYRTGHGKLQKAFSLVTDCSGHNSIVCHFVSPCLLRYQLSNAVNDDGTYTDGGWYICEEEEKVPCDFM